MNVSFLFAAGFSKPAGYPIASEVSAQVLRVQASGIAATSEGKAWLRQEFIEYLRSGVATPFEELEDEYSYPRREAKAALEAMLEVYAQHHELTDYEAFYDDLVEFLKEDSPLRITPEFTAAYLRRGLHNDSTQPTSSAHVHQAIHEAHRIFVQLVGQAIEPDPRQASPKAAAAYRALVQLLRKYGAPVEYWFSAKIPHNFYLHTLNHDLLLEELLRSDFTGVGYSDGFHEAGSPYYGRLEFSNDFPQWLRQWPRHAMVRIPEYTGVYDKPVQLYKLHGSLDYYGFVGRDSLYERQVMRKQPWLDDIHVYREVKRDGRMTYDMDYSNYHPLFLTGTTAKLSQYDDPVLFKQLLTHFEQNLAKSDALVVIGYGFRDEGINARILPFLQDPAKHVIVVGRSMPTWFPAVQESMFRAGGLEAYDFGELEALLNG